MTASACPKLDSASSSWSFPLVAITCDSLLIVQPFVDQAPLLHRDRAVFLRRTSFAFGKRVADGEGEHGAVSRLLRVFRSASETPARVSDGMITSVIIAFFAASYGAQNFSRYSFTN